MYEILSKIMFSIIIPIGVTIITCFLLDRFDFSLSKNKTKNQILRNLPQIYIGTITDVAIDEICEYGKIFVRSTSQMADQTYLEISPQLLDGQINTCVLKVSNHTPYGMVICNYYTRSNENVNIDSWCGKTVGSFEKRILATDSRDRPSRLICTYRDISIIHEISISNGFVEGKENKQLKYRRA